jgi:poly-D-alanine transfer protein DltD
VSLFFISPKFLKSAIKPPRLLASSQEIHKLKFVHMKKSNSNKVTKTQFLSIRFTRLEKEAIRSLAKQSGLSTGAFLRNAALGVKLHRIMTDDELKAYETLHSFYTNFKRISNLIRGLGLDNSTADLQKEIRSTIDLLTTHLNKFK